MKTAFSKQAIIADRYAVTEVIDVTAEWKIEYLCTDIVTEKQVLIREFYPEGALRDEAGNLEYNDMFRPEMNRFREKHKLIKTFSMMPTVIPVMDIFDANNTCYAVCGLTDGVSVAKLIAEKQDIPFISLKNTIINLLKTNEALMQFGLCQDNFRPKNVLITSEGHVKISDFDPVSDRKRESEAIKSIAELGYFMATGEMLSKKRKSGKKSEPAGSFKTVAKYMKYIYFGKDQTVDTARMIEDAKQNFEVKIPGGFAQWMTSLTSTKKRTGIIIGAAAAVVLIIAAAVGVGMAGKNVKNTRNIVTVAYNRTGNEENNETVEFNRDFDSIKDLLEEKHVATIAEVPAEGVTLYFTLTNSDERYSFSVKHGEEVIAEQENAPGKYVITTKNPPEAIEIVSEYKIGFISQKATYTIHYTSKKLAKFNSISYKIGDGEPVPITENDITLPNGTTEISLVVDKDEQFGYKLTVNDQEVSDGKVILDAEKDTIVKIIVTGGEEYETTENSYIFKVAPKDKITIPNVVGLSEEKAKAVIENAGADVAVKYEENKKVAKGCVIRQSEDGAVDVGITVTITVSTGKPKENEQQEDKKSAEETIDIPSVTGMPEAEAKTKLINAGANPMVSREASSTVASGNVIRQSVTGSAKRGTTVTIYVSSGAGVDEKFSVPNVVGKSEADAKSALKNAGMEVAVQSAESDTVRQGYVIEQNITSPSPKGTTITITVSKGSTAQNTITIPDVTGKPANGAKSAITKAGGGVKIEYEESSTVEKGKVIRQSVVGQASKGVKVTIYISEGSSVVYIPSVVGFSEAAAIETIESMGVRVVVKYTPDPGERGIVTKQSAQGNVAAGSTITIYVSEGS